MPTRKTHAAFSLVELSIVLVILGLLTGGILGGQSLIRAAELRKVSTDVNRYKTALLTFRDKYFALPGDMQNASAFWGAADGSTGLTAGCATATAAGTCNGNGDGQITLGPENYRLWQQLNLAGLVEGSYSGVPGPAPTGANVSDVIGTNTPRFPINSGGFGIAYQWSDPLLSSFTSRQNVLVAAPCCHPTNQNVEGGLVRAEEMWNIDTKMDDGRPRTGSVQVYTALPNCEASGEYSLPFTSNSCMPYFGLGL